MKVYEFACPQCKAITLDPDPHAKIQHCESEMKRKYSIAGIHFKGPGFYARDQKFPGR